MNTVFINRYPAPIYTSDGYKMSQEVRLSSIPCILIIFTLWGTLNNAFPIVFTDIVTIFVQTMGTCAFQTLFYVFVWAEVSIDSWNEAQVY